MWAAIILVTAVLAFLYYVLIVLLFSAPNHFEKITRSIDASANVVSDCFESVSPQRSLSNMNAVDTIIKSMACSAA